MEKLSVYEQVGIVIPGSLLLFGLLLYFPDLRVLTVKDGVSVGELGVFVLISYAAGHLVAAIGNALEAMAWKPFGGMPWDWVLREPPALLDVRQVENLRAKVGTRLSIALEKIAGLDKKVWWPVSRQIYADVAKNGKPDRVDTFNGIYGLNRGLTSACLVLAVVGLYHHMWLAAVGLLLAALVYSYRAYRFGVYYARELYLQFLILPDTEKD